MTRKQNTLDIQILNGTTDETRSSDGFYSEEAPQALTKSEQDALDHYITQMEADGPDEDGDWHEESAGEWARI